MDFNLKEINLHLFLWYILPGLNFIGINIIIPVIVLSPKLLNQISSVGNILSIIFAALIIGFIMDSLKVYRFTIGYRKIHQGFFGEIAKELSIPPNKTQVAFEIVFQMSKGKDPLPAAINFKHSQALMINHTSKCFYLLGLTWFVLLTFNIAEIYTPRLLFGAIPVLDEKLVLVLYILLLIITSLAGNRLSRISKNTLRLIDDLYLVFIRKNRDHILSSMSVTSGVVAEEANE